MHADYARKVRTLDSRWFPDAAPGQGPVMQKLSTYGVVRGLVFGAFGEMSEDLDALAFFAAERGSHRSRVANAISDPEDIRDRRKY